MKASVQRRKIISKLLSLGIICSLVALFLADRQKGVLPVADMIDQQVLYEPLQEKTKEREFALEHAGKRYGVQPVATYELAGVVVTHNDIGSITDMYHSSDSVDIKDLCVVWGESAASGAYTKNEYWSEAWTCHYRPKQNRIDPDFDHAQLSNNHLLAGDSRIQNLIKQTRIGDQIRFSGYLVNYYPVGASEQLRKSSLTREDQGNGACEVVFVKDYEILTHATPAWYAIWDWARRIILILVLLKIVTFLLFPYLEYRER